MRDRYTDDEWDELEEEALEESIEARRQAFEDIKKEEDFYWEVEDDLKKKKRKNKEDE